MLSCCGIEMCSLHLPEAAARICPSALHLAKCRGKSCMEIERKGGEMGTEVGLLEGEELNNGGQ